MLGVSGNGYYTFKNRKPSSRQLKMEKRMEEIRQIHKESHEIYGAPKIADEMRKNEDRISNKTVGNYMRKTGVKACYVKHSIKTTIQPDFNRKLRNILKQQFNPEEPNAVWCSDITYIWTYTSIMDLYSRKIIAWVLSDTLEAKWVMEAIEKAKKERHVDKPEVMHSDRGIQYTCDAYREATEGWKLSYSKKAYPWDNACIESFHAILKREWINRFRIMGYEHVYRLVFEYINTFYNTMRYTAIVAINPHRNTKMNIWAGWKQR